MKKMVSNKYVNLLLNIVFIALGAAAIYLIATTVLKWLLPFIIAYGLAYIIDPAVTFLEKKAKIPRRFASAITVVFALASIVFLITFIVYRIVYEIKELLERLPALTAMLSERVDLLLSKGVNIYVNLPIELSQFVDKAVNALVSNLSSLVGPLTEATTKFAKSLPTILIFIIVLLISTYFMSSDKQKIHKFLLIHIPASWISRATSVKNDLLFALLGYIKAQLILMSITFVELTIGFAIIGVDYAILLALIISLIDAIPVLGTGTVLIPWALFSLIMGNYILAFSLLVLYGIALLVRQLLEPRVLGGQIGLYPLVTLMSMYIGLKVFGIVGMILGPIITLIVKNLYKAGIFKVWQE